VKQSIGTHSAGKRWFKRETRGIARYVMSVETGGNGTVSNATDVPMGSQYLASIVEMMRE
jgi:hypothetical protein